MRRPAAGGAVRATVAAVLLALLVLAFAATVGSARSASVALRFAPDVSSNWAGYVATGPGSTTTTASSSMTYTDVTGSWVEPKAICRGMQSSVALWVGLGGYSLKTRALEQAGTEIDCSPGGTTSYYAWYELVPANSVVVKTLKIDPGDLITSSVVVNGNNVLVQVIDRTRDRRFTKRLMMHSPDVSSADWIAEAPCSPVGARCVPLALTDFATVTFAHTFATGNSLAGTITSPNWIANAMELIPHAHRFFGVSDHGTSAATGAGAMPVGLAADGSGFTVQWEPDVATSSANPDQRP